MCSLSASQEMFAGQWRATLIPSASQLRPCVLRLKILSLRAPLLLPRLRRLSSRALPRWLPDRAALYQLLGLFAYLLTLSCRDFHRAVPPTVMLSSFRVGMPTPTGTDWPSLPQVPTPSSSWRSFPTIDTFVSASGPLPISVQFFNGAVTWPFSIM